MARVRPSRPLPSAPPLGPRGTPLGEDEMARVSVTPWTPALEYAWDAGEAISRFLQGLQEGRILGVRCRRCGRTVTPPRTFCEVDFRPMDEWVELPDTGTINTFSICYVTWDMKPLRRPQIPAVIEIDGTAPRVGFLHLIGGVRGRTVDDVRRQISVGTPVRAVWKPPRQRTGAITDILYFTPVKSRARP